MSYVLLEPIKFKCELSMERLKRESFAFISFYYSITIWSQCKLQCVSKNPRRNLSRDFFKVKVNLVERRMMSWGISIITASKQPTWMSVDREWSDVSENLSCIFASTTEKYVMTVADLSFNYRHLITSFLSNFFLF